MTCFFNILLKLIIILFLGLYTERNTTTLFVAESGHSSISFSHKKGPIERFDVDAVLGLANFERFVFVLCVLERYREHECALLLGCSASGVREACTQAIQELARFRPGVFDVYGDRERGGWAEALKA